MTLLTVSSLTTANDLNELDILDQKLVKGGLFNNNVEFDRETILQNISGVGHPPNLKNQVVATGNAQVIIDSVVQPGTPAA